MEKKTIIDYIGQVFLIYGITIVILNIFCLLVGEDAQSVSTMFAIGNAGLSVSTMLQFLGVSICIVAARFLFFTDVIIKNMPIVVRTICMVTVVIAIIATFIVLFGWFPVNMWLPWLMFLLCFGISFLISMVVVCLKERIENRKMEEALVRLKQEEDKS